MLLYLKSGCPFLGAIWFAGKKKEETKETSMQHVNNFLVYQETSAPQPDFDSAAPLVVGLAAAGALPASPHPSAAVSSDAGSAASAEPQPSPPPSASPAACSTSSSDLSSNSKGSSPSGLYCSKKSGTGEFDSINSLVRSGPRAASRSL